MASLPVLGHSAVVYEDKLVVYGGVDKNQQTLGDVWYMDVNGGGELMMMMPRGKVPCARSFHTAHEFEGVMYVVHGITADGGADVGMVPALNLANGEWMSMRTSGTLPPPRCNHASCIHSNTIYMFGGLLTPPSETDTSLYALNLHSLIWTKIETTPTPTPLWGHTMVTCGKNLVVYGGGSTKTEEPSDQIWVFSFRHKTWRWFTTTGPDRPGSTGPQLAKALYDYTPKAAHQIQLTKNDLLILSPDKGGSTRSIPGWIQGRVDGTTEEGYIPENYIELIENPSRADSVSTFSAASAPKSRYLHAAASTDSDRSFIIHGGEVGQQEVTKYNDTWLFNLKKGRWKQLSKRTRVQPPPCSGQPMVWYQGVAWLPALVEKKVYRLDLETGWTEILVRPQPIEDSMGAVISPRRREKEKERRDREKEKKREPSPQRSVTAGSRYSEVPSPQTQPAYDPEQQQQQPRSPPQEQRHVPREMSVAQSQHDSVQRSHKTAVVQGVSIGSDPNGNVVVENSSSVNDQKTVVVYVMGGSGMGGGGGSGGQSMPGILPGGVSSVYTPTPVPADNNSIGYTVPGYHGGSLTSIPANNLFEPGRQRLASRTRTSSPHVHTPSEFKSRPVPKPPSPPRSPALMPKQMPPPADTPLPSQAPMSEGFRSSTPASMFHEQTRLGQSQPAGMLQEPQSQLIGQSHPASVMQEPGIQSQPASMLQEPGAQSQPMGHGGHQSSATPEQFEQEEAMSPAPSGPRTETPSAVGLGTPVARGETPAPSEAPEARVGPGTPRVMPYDEPVFSRQGREAPRLGSVTPQEGGGFYGAPANHLHCPRQPETPPKPLTPTNGHPNSPPRSTSTTHTNYREPSSMSALPVMVDGPAGTHVSEDRNLWHSAQAHRSISRHEALGWSRTPQRLEDRNTGGPHLWC